MCTSDCLEFTIRRYDASRNFRTPLMCEGKKCSAATPEHHIECLFDQSENLSAVELDWLILWSITTASQEKANVIPANSTQVPCVAVHPAAACLVLHQKHNGQLQSQRSCYGKMLMHLPCSSAVHLVRCA